MSARLTGRKRIRVEKAHNKETMPVQPITEANYRPDASVNFLKASVDPPKFRERLGATPHKPVFVIKGTRKFRGVAIPKYIKPEDIEVDTEATYMGISLPSGSAETCLIEPLNLASIPTIVHGLADLVVKLNVYQTLVPGNPVYWPSGDKGTRIGRLVQTLVTPTVTMDGRVRICVDSVGEHVFKNV